MQNDHNDHNDKQIMGLQLLAIALGLCSFAHLLANREVVVYSDDVGPRYGQGSREELGPFLHCARSMAQGCSDQHMGMWIVRVPSNDNIADLPPRSVFQLLHRLNAVEASSVLDDSLFEPSAWRSAVAAHYLVSRSPSVLCKSLEVSTTFK